MLTHSITACGLHVADLLTWLGYSDAIHNYLDATTHCNPLRNAHANSANPLTHNYTRGRDDHHAGQRTRRTIVCECTIGHAGAVR